MKYCSKWCGLGCTKEEYQAAKKIAEAMVDALGNGWKAHLNHNRGWFASAKFKGGYISVHYSRYQKASWYTAYISWERAASGGQWVANAASPRRALLRAMKDFSASLDKLEAVNRAINSARDKEWVGVV